MSKLNGWPIKKLAELCETFADGDWVESKDQSPAGVRLIQTGNVGDGLFKDRGEKARYVSEATFNRLRCTEVFAGDCLISRLPDPVGRSCILPETGVKMITAVDCTIARFKRDILPEFFNYYSQSDQYLRNVDSETTGTTRKRISRSKLGETRIPLPPLPEQRRIVGILDEAFAAIATAKANTEKNLQNARDVFAGELHALLAPRSNWEVVRLADLATDVTDGDHLPPPKSQTGVPFITISNIVKDSRTIDFTDTFKVPESYYRQLKPNRRPQSGDVLYTVTGSFGIPVLVNGYGEFCFQRHIGLVRPNAETDSKFLYYLLSSPHVLDQANERATGTAQKTVSLKVLRDLAVPRVALPEQREIVARLDGLTLETQRLWTVYERKLSALEDLKKSLLHHAFMGNL